MLEPTSKTVSVIIPSFNGYRTIRQTLQSLNVQIHRPLRVIVVDDGSNDQTREALLDSISLARNINAELILHDENKGLAQSLNDGLGHTRGDYVLILHQDCELVGEDWLSRALDLIDKDQTIAVVTGYYGIPSNEDMNFAKKAFSVLRKQIHTRPSCSTEEVTFSEGKCDIYRKDVLEKVGNFPSRYTIAGEDLVLSYKIRSLGYKIVKSYELPVVQRFGGRAETLWGNLEKEFVFGRALGGVFSEFGFFLFRHLGSSAYSRVRSLHRASQPIYVAAVTGVGIATAAFGSPYAWIVLALLVGRLVYYYFRVVRSSAGFPLLFSHVFLEGFAVAFIGILADFAYGLGFVYGIIRHGLGMRI